MTGFLTYDLAEGFALSRNKSLNFSFLKENGELLCIARSQGFLMEPKARDLYRDFYSKASHLVELYPQYYRFLLGIVVDLEDLGMAGNIGGEICHHIRAKNLLEFDTSDTRRLEALYLLSRVSPLNAKEVETKRSIENRLESFTQYTDRFFKFNRPLFYDLTHIVFFITDYGRKRLEGFSNLKNCLLSVGFLSILDNDLDLLSEVMICLKYIGEPIPEHWKQIIMEKQSMIDISFEQKFTSSLNSSVDDYHIYFTLNWCLSILGKPAFTKRFNSKTPSFKHIEQKSSLLSKLSVFAHDRVMKKNAHLHAIEAFIASIKDEEFDRFNHAIASTHISHECLREFVSQNLSIAA